MNPTSSSPRITVLGIGNLLWADEGFGVRCVEALQQRYEFAGNVTLIDGGTQGLYLIQHVQQADYLLIFDAVDYNMAPGTLKFVADDEVPRFLGVKKLSLHQTGFQEVLMLAQLIGHYPQRVLLMGCQPERMDDYGGSLRPPVKAALELAIDAARQVLEDWGGAPRTRTAPLPEEEAVTMLNLDLQRYESERPSEQDACRVGDERILGRRS